MSTIRRIQLPKDSDLLTVLLESLPHDTLMRYGRFSEEERTDAIVNILHDIRNGSEIGFGYFASYGEIEVMLAYLHFNISNKFSRRGYQASLGIVVSHLHQGKGLGSELVKYGLEQMRKQGYKKIWLHVHFTNSAARKLYHRAGFISEGLFVNDQIIDGKVIDVISMAKFLE